MKHQLIVFAAAVLAAMFVSGCGKPAATSGAGGPATPASAALRIAVIPKGSTHDYWKSVHAGADKAAGDLKAKGVNVDILWKGPLKEDDRNGQIDVVQTFQTQHVDGIVVAPLDATALVSPIESAIASGIPVVIFDSPLKSDKPVSTVATNNEQGGELAAARLIELLGGKGKVLMLRYQVGSASTEAREAGFLSGIKKASGITIVSQDQYAGPTVDTAFASAQNVLGRYGSQIDGVFTPNESSTVGMIRALDGIGKLGKVKFVGFDSDPDLLRALTAKQVQGLVLQNPYKMGYEAVTTMAAAIRKQKVPAAIDTGVSMATPDNMNTPTVKALLNPPVE